VQGSKAKKLPGAAQRSPTEEGLGRPCRARSGPAPFGGQPKPDSRPQADRRALSRGDGAPVSGPSTSRLRRRSRTAEHSPASACGSVLHGLVRGSPEQQKVRPAWWLPHLTSSCRWPVNLDTATQDGQVEPDEPVPDTGAAHDRCPRHSGRRTHGFRPGSHRARGGPGGVRRGHDDWQKVVTGTPTNAAPSAKSSTRPRGTGPPLPNGSERGHPALAARRLRRSTCLLMAAAARAQLTWSNGQEPAGPTKQRSAPRSPALGSSGFGRKPGAKPSREPLSLDPPIVVA